jgi:FlaA1/EpsC-like NDP-sugar epimerase
MGELTGKIILIIGGTVSFGNTIVKHIFGCN